MYSMGRCYPSSTFCCLSTRGFATMKPTYGLTLDRWGSASDSGALGHSLALGALNAPTES